MGPPELVVEVLPDVSGLDRRFHYSVPAGLADVAPVGSIVRVVLHGRRVRGWVVAAGVDAPADVAVQPIVEVVSVGPPPAVVSLCEWGAWRFAGRLRPLLLAASPERLVRRLEAWTPPVVPSAGVAEVTPVDRLVAEALAAGDAVLRLPPTSARLPVVAAVLRRCPGQALVLVESRDDAHRLARQLARIGWPVALLPAGWPAAAAGAPVVIGTRNAALAPGRPSVVVVLDAHSGAYRSERVPSLDARVLAHERAVRDGIPVLFVTPCPPLELLDGRPVVVSERSWERSGWGRVAVLDKREEDPREGGYPSRLAMLVHEAAGASAGRPVLLVLNRRGRARLLACASCREVQRCELCGAAAAQRERPAKGSVGVLCCPRCGTERPAVCPACGSARLRILRPGVSRAREELEALLRLPVGEVAGPRTPVPSAPVLIGTEAVLHRVGSAALVAFLEFDQELLAPRFRAAEEALVLVARALRLTAAGAGHDGAHTGVSLLPQVLLRTSMPFHEVVQAAQRGDPSVVTEAEAPRRRMLGLPPSRALALVTGEEAEARLAALLAASPGGAAAEGSGLEVRRVGEGRFVVSAPDPVALADGLALLVAHMPGGWASAGVRVEVNPVDL